MAMASKSFLLSVLLLAALLQSATSQGGSPSHASAACVSNFKCSIQLSPDLEMRYKIVLPELYQFRNVMRQGEEEECNGCEVVVQLVYDGYAWLGIAPSPKGKMIGSRAAIGVPDSMDPRTHLLNAKDVDGVAPVPFREEQLVGASCEYIDGQTVMQFRTSFANWGIKSPVGPSLNNLHTFVWAHGGNRPGGPTYHGPDHRSSFTITDLMGFGSSSQEEEGFAMAGHASAMSKRAAWKAHGVLAFFAFGVFVPTAIAAALLRDAGDSTRVPAFCERILGKVSKRWLSVHVGSNAAAYVVAFVACSVAVGTIRNENYRHWHSAHARMGMIIFLVATVQVVGGYFRPAKAAVPRDGDGDANVADDEVQNENTVGTINAQIEPLESSLRPTWELFHRACGLGLFFLGMWQMQEGMDLYHERYDNANFSTLAGLYISWMALWMLVIVGGAMYKWLHRGIGESGSGDGVELKQKDRLDELAMREDRELT